MNKILRYFLQGLILLIPFIITVVVLVKLYQFLEGLFAFVGFTNYAVLNTLIVFVFILIVITVFGLLASSFIFQKLFNFIEDRLEHAPFIRHIYSPIKDFMNAFMGNKKKFKKPVIVLTNPQANVHEIGFVTQDDLSDIGIKDKVAVYLPYAYSFSGRLLIVPAENVQPLNVEGADAMKFIISGGVTDVDKED